MNGKTSYLVANIIINPETTKHFGTFLALKKEFLFSCHSQLRCLMRNHLNHLDQIGHINPAIACDIGLSFDKACRIPAHDIIGNSMYVNYCHRCTGTLDRVDNAVSLLTTPDPGACTTRVAQLADSSLVHHIYT